MVTDEDDTHDYACLISLDPGGTTGWNVIMVHPDALEDEDVSILANIMHYDQGQFEGTELEQADEIISLWEAWDNAALVCESFELRQADAELQPVIIRAMLEWYLHKLPRVERRPLFVQSPSLVMNSITDARLKRWGIYHKGQEHARDSLRHSIMFLRRAKEDQRIRKLAWPQLFGG